MLDPLLGMTAERWLPLFTDLAVKSAVVLAVTLTVWAWMRRAPAASRHLILLAGIAALLGLPALMLFVPRQSLPSPITQTAAPAPFPAVTFAMPPPSLSAVPKPSTVSPALFPPPSLPPSLPAKPTLAPFPWAVWLLAAWAAGVTLSTARVLAAHLRVWRLICHCPSLPKDFRASLPEVAATLRLGPAGTPPLVWGGLCPTLLLPAEALAWPKARLQAVLLHETAHLQRRDWLTQTLTQIVCALYWFNPLVWLTAHQIQAEAERACDDAVLLAGVPPADYAADLLAVARSLTAHRLASAGAVTMARRSPVRGRLEAILDTRRPRQSVTRRAAALSLFFTLAAALPLASLRPAAHADSPTVSLTAPSAGIPTEADIAAVQQHLRSLEQERTSYAAAHPNTLSHAQMTDVYLWISQLEFNRGQEEFDVNAVRDIARLRVEAKKSHSKQEQEKISEQILEFKHIIPETLQDQRSPVPQFTRLQRRVALLPAEQRTREQKMYALAEQIDAEKIQIELMEQEKSKGQSFYLHDAETIPSAHSKMDGEKSTAVSSADWIHTQFLERKLQQQKHLDNTDVDSLIAILHEPLQSHDMSHANVMVLFRDMHDIKMRPVPTSQQQKIRDAVTAYRTSYSQWALHDEWGRIFAKQVLNLYDGTAPPPTPKTSPALTPAAALIPAPPHSIGISPMTPLNNLKTALLKTAAFTTLASSLALPAANAGMVKHAGPLTAPAAGTRGGSKMQEQVRPFQVAQASFPPVQNMKQLETMPEPTSFGTKKIFLQNLVPDTILSLLHWNQRGVLPEGVKQISALPKENALLVQATPAGFTKIQEIIKVVDVAPRQVEVRLALANAPKANLDAFGVNFVLVPQNEQPAASVTNKPADMLMYLDGNIAAQLLQTFTKQGKVMEAPLITTSNNVQASITITGSQSALHSSTVTPRINHDDTITVQLHITISVPYSGRSHPHQTPVNTIQEINTVRTVRSGSTLALNISAPMPNAGSDHSLLLFVTPTIVGTQKSTTVTTH